MKATGMIRRIDELGRVVIPKEIRRTMRLKEGEELEIFAEGEGLVLKKYSALTELGEVALGYAQVLARETSGGVMITDRDRVLATASIKGEGQDLPVAIERVFASRRSAETHLGESKAWVEPIIARGDLLGGVVLVKEDPTPSDRDKTRLLSRLLERQLEGD